MKANLTSAPESPQEFSIRLGNLAPDDRRFLENLVSLFADPKLGDHLHRLKCGESVIRYQPSGGLTLHTSRR